MSKFRPGEPVWVVDGEEPEIRYPGTIVRLKGVGREEDTGRIVELYAVRIPKFPQNDWEVTHHYLRRRDEPPAQMPNDSDATPRAAAHWGNSVWAPGEWLAKQGKIFIPDKD